MGLARLGNLSKSTAPAFIYFGVKLMFVGVMNFGQNQKIMLVGGKNFQSYSNQILVILIWSSKLASNLV